MNWEAVTAISTALTAIVILLTVIIGRTQLDQLRRSTQLEGVTALSAELEGPTQQAARRFVMFELAEKMKDPMFRQGVALVGAADDAVHKELVVLRFFERIGTLINERILNGPIFYDTASGRIFHMWLLLQDVIAIHRQTMGERSWIHFEQLVERTKEWQLAHGLTPDRYIEVMKSNRHGDSISARD